MLLYEIADDVHWLMLTRCQTHKKVCCVPRLCTLTNATYEQTADLSLYTWYVYIHTQRTPIFNPFGFVILRACMCACV